MALNAGLHTLAQSLRTDRWQEPFDVTRSKPRLTPGRAFYFLWHAPRGALERASKEGALNLLLSAAGRRAMEHAAWGLPISQRAASDAPTVSFLTGDRYWYQTAFCAASLNLASGEAFKIEIVDDGTLRLSQIGALRRIFPGIQIISSAETEARLDAALPKERYPTLRHHRKVYPHIRKITDVHAGRLGPRLVLDSDMLFFARPGIIIDWLAEPKSILHMSDVGDFYGYAPEILAGLAGAPLPHRVNVGVCGLDGSALDWDRLEAWTASLLERIGPHYLLEQALIAMMVTSVPATACPADTYIVGPTRAESQHPTATLHHYVGNAKAWYFRFAWREALARLKNATVS